MRPAAGLGIFFDTFQNLDHSHHHKHPYIYAMTNDGTKGYIPDAEVRSTRAPSHPSAEVWSTWSTRVLQRAQSRQRSAGPTPPPSGVCSQVPDPATQALPGAVDNSGCSFEFRYFEGREDVSVLNHTRVHVTFRGGTLKLRLQQTSQGEAREWFQCFDMKDVALPSSG